MNLPQEQHTDLLEAADIISSYFLTEVRICDDVISGGKVSEAARLSSYSSLRKPKAISTVSCDLFPSIFFGFLVFSGRVVEGLYVLLLGSIVRIEFDRKGFVD